jgi:hypothetical protein
MQGFAQAHTAEAAELELELWSCQTTQPIKYLHSDLSPIPKSEWPWVLSDLPSRPNAPGWDFALCGNLPSPRGPAMCLSATFPMLLGQAC